ncbi:MAG: hypothetical protein ACOCVX_04810 [Bacteroidales bacterium]
MRKTGLVVFYDVGVSLRSKHAAYYSENITGNTEGTTCYSDILLLRVGLLRADGHRF